MSRAMHILRDLKEAGERGVFSYDLINSGGLRYSARINDLKQMGYGIISKPEKRGRSLGCRYFLVSEPDYDNGQY